MQNLTCAVKTVCRTLGLLKPVYSDTTQLNSTPVLKARPVYSDTTQLDVELELRRRSIYSDADTTQLDVELSTRSQREQLLPINERSDPVCRS